MVTLVRLVQPGKAEYKLVNVLPERSRLTNLVLLAISTEPRLPEVEELPSRLFTFNLILNVVVAVLVGWLVNHVPNSVTLVNGVRRIGRVSLCVAS